MANLDELRVPVVYLAIAEDADVAIARRRAGEFAIRAGLPGPKAHALVTAVSEIVRNIVVHASGGALILELSQAPDRAGVVVTASDRGPGIPDLAAALTDGHSTVGTLGLGLPSARRLVDDFAVTSRVGEGTVVTLKMWAHDWRTGR